MKLNHNMLLKKWSTLLVSGAMVFLFSLGYAGNVAADVVADAPANEGYVSNIAADAVADAFVNELRMNAVFQWEPSSFPMLLVCRPADRCVPGSHYWDAQGCPIGCCYSGNCNSCPHTCSQSNS